MNNNHLKIITESASIKPQSQQSMSTKSSSSGTATPTSDLVDDSGVSEDNASSINSGSELGGCSSSSSSSGSSSIYRTTVRTPPKSFATTTTSRERDTETIDTDDMDDANNNTINKNRTNHPNQMSPTSSIIHLSQGGSAVIEYKTVSNSSQKSNIIPNTVSSLNNNSSPVIGAINGTANIIKTVSPSTQSTTTTSTISMSTTPHTHFHKKYIKAMNALNGSGTDTVTTLTPTPITNSNSQAQISSPSTIVSVSTPTAIYTIPMKTEFR